MLEKIQCIGGHSLFSRNKNSTVPSIEEIEVGKKLSLTEKIKDRDLLLYLGLTNDSNPVYIQHAYCRETTLEKPIVPSIMLVGLISAAISKYLPGPGAYIIEQQVQLKQVVYHDEILQIFLEVVHKDSQLNEVTIEAKLWDEQKRIVLEGKFVVALPYLKERE